VKASAMAVREAEAARKRHEQALVRAQKVTGAEQNHLEKEARASHEEAMNAEVASLN